MSDEVNCAIQHWSMTAHRLVIIFISEGGLKYGDVKVRSRAMSKMAAARRRVPFVDREVYCNACVF